MSKVTRICLWSGPRNVSTALMYSFAQRSDCRVFDEPLYAHYLSKIPVRANHPGEDEVIATMENDGEKVVRDLILGDHGKPVLFFKHMVHHLLQLDRGFLTETVNVLLTRDPVDMLPSFAPQMQNLGLRDVGYKQHVELLEYLQSIGQNPLVLDSKQILLNPRKVLSEFCERIGIPFDETMLHWEMGARPEDGSWAKFWYKSVHKSTGFGQYVEKTELFPDALKALLAECQPYYEQLNELAIKA